MALQMGIRLKIARKDAGLSRKDIADALGTTHASIARWEQEGVSIPSTALPTISRMTGKPIEYFVLEDHELSETKMQSARALAEIIDSRDSEIDALKSKIKHLEEIIKRADNLDKAIEMLKEEKKDVG